MTRAWTVERIAELRATWQRRLAAAAWSQAHFAQDSGLADGRTGPEAIEVIRASLDAADTIITAEREAILDAIARCLDDARSAREQGVPAVFVFTRAVKQAFHAVSALVSYSAIGLLTGAPGMGKSYTIGAALAEFPSAVAVAVDSDSRTSRGLARKIAAALGWKAARPRIDDIARLLKPRLGAKALRVVIIDQAHLLKPSALQLICDLLDGSGCSFLLVGTIALHRMTADDVDPLFGQLASRIGLRVDLAAEIMRGGPGGGGALYTLDDIRALCRQLKIKLADDGARMLWRLANEPGGGHLRRVMRLAHWAERFAARRGADAIGSADILAALALVTGEPHEGATANPKAPQGHSQKEKATA